MVDLIKFSSVCNRMSVPVLEQSQLVYVLTEILPGSFISNVRQPLNFALVLDRSGSMAGEKLRTMQEAVKRVIDQLNDHDLISIITFESRTEILSTSQPAINKNGLKKLVDQIRDGGGTNIAPALTAALGQVSVQANEGRVNRIVLLTDGEVTDLETDSFQVAAEAGARGIPIIGLGFGSNWKEEFLFELADRSILANSGSHIGTVEYIPTPEKAGKIFQDVFQSMHIVAHDVLVTFRMVQGLEARRVWQVAPIIREQGSFANQGRSIQIQIKNLDQSGAAFLFEIMLPPRPEGSVRIAQADLTFTTADQGAQRQAVDLILNYSQEPSHTDVFDSRVMNVVEKVQAFRLQTQALEDAEMGEISNATRKLRQAVTILLAQGETELANQIGHEADRLEHSGAVSNEGKKTILLTSRKTVRLSE